METSEGMVGGDSLNPQQVIGTVVAVCFVCAVTYTYAFSVGLGVELTKYFDIVDFVRGSIAWLVKAALLLAAGICIHGFFQRIEGGKNPESWLNDPTTPKFTRLIWRLADSLAVISLFLWSGAEAIRWYFGYVQAAEALQLLMFSIPTLWFTAVVWYFGHPLLREGWNLKYALLLLFVPPLILHSYLFGLRNGIETATDPEITHRIIISSGESGMHPINGSVLFALSRYVVFRDNESGNVLVIPIVKIDRVQELAPPTGWIFAPQPITTAP